MAEQVVEDVKPIVTSNGLVYPRAMPVGMSDLLAPSRAGDAAVTASTAAALVAHESTGSALAAQAIAFDGQGQNAPVRSGHSIGGATTRTHEGGMNLAAAPLSSGQHGVVNGSVTGPTATGKQQEWLAPSTPTNFGAPGSATSNTASGEPSAKRQRIRHAKPENTCSICGHHFKYIRHHYAKWHPNLKLPDGVAALDARSVRDGTTPGAAAAADGHDWRTAGRPLESSSGGNSSVTGTPMGPRMTFGGVSAGRFCARCGLVVEDLDLHRRLEHGIPTSDTESISNPIVQYENGTLPPLASSSKVQHPPETTAPEGNTLARNAALRIHDAIPTTTSSRNMTPAPRLPQTPQSANEAKPTRSTHYGRIASSSSMEEAEEPYEKLLRIIRATSELSPNQKSSLIFDVLKQQVQLLSQSSATSLLSLAKQRRQSTAYETTPETPAQVEQVLESDGALRRQSQITRDGDAQYVSPMHRGKNGMQRNANDDDLYS